ncbi:MAG: glutamate racemase [Candidatus Saccharibacteria bacterium]|nr:glutamate racemase [Candidatus Saccharibacteria bacterium]
MTKIGVFDSGVGGEFVAAAIAKALPEDEIVYREDRKNVPYGNKTIAEIYAACRPVIQSLVDDGCQVIVIACNTVTTNLIDKLRDEITVPLVGMEPMVKPAAAVSKSGVIAVCATPRTLSSLRYKQLKQQYAAHTTVIEPDCSDWASMIENNEVDRSVIKQRLDETLQKGADQIVLGCTHYHWIEELIVSIVAGKASVMQPTDPVIKQLKRVLEQQL